MKKNISINISGIIFHIEEDGFDVLRKYLDSINKYFASFEDSSEILADIESRVAEIFLSKLNEGKQVITADDVNSLIATMGSVSDFRAAEEQEFASGTKAKASSQNSSSGYSDTGSSGNTYNTYASTKLYRDERRKILGGVSAGIANYFKVDPVWIRLLFALTAFAYGITILVYIVMWIVAPGTSELEEPEIGKKMFRDPEHKVIGGVSGGLAAYFGIDLIAVRLLFIVFTIFFGIGLLIYIVLWIALPEAKTLTDRMEMQGEPVTLSNIESNIKKNLNVDPNKEESLITKILLLPFRVIGILLGVLAKILVPLVDVLRVAIGIMVVLFGVGMLFSVVVSSGVFAGLFSTTAFSWPLPHYGDASLPLEVFAKSISWWLVIAAIIAMLVPSVFLVILGVSVIVRRYVINSTVGWTLFVLFFISIVMLSVGIPRIIYSFKEEGEFRVENTYNLNGKTAVLHINEVGMDDFDVTSLTLKGHSSPTFRLVQEFEAQGTTRQEAINNAKMVTYDFNVQDSLFTFDSNIRFKEDAIFRGQRLNMTLFIPYDQPFVLDEASARFITNYINYDELDGYTWIFTEKDGLTCQTCPAQERDDDESIVSDEFGLNNFSELELNGVFEASIFKGDDYAVELLGSDSEKGKYNIFKSGSTLVVEYEGGKRKFDWDKEVMNVNQVRINITMPELERIEANGFGKIKFEEFEANDMDIDLRGPIKATGAVSARSLTINLTGKSDLDISGKVSNLEADVQLASKLRAYNLEATDAVVEVNGASSAKVNVSNTLEFDEGIASDVDYRGQPNVIRRD